MSSLLAPAFLGLGSLNSFHVQTACIPQSQQSCWCETSASSRFPGITGKPQDKMDNILDIVTATKALVGLQNHFSHAALWAPFSKPKKSVGSASLAALRDSEFKHNVAEAMGAPEDVCMVLNKQLPRQFICGGHIIPVSQVKV